MRGKPERVPESSLKPKLSAHLVRRIILAVCLICLATNSVFAEYVARKTQVDTSKFPVIRVFVSITDTAGNPIPDNNRVGIIIRENGEPVSRVTLSEGHNLASVLVLDVSGSMAGEKLEKAKAAAINYVNLAQPNHQIAIVTFSDSAQRLSDFTTDKAALRSKIGTLFARGQTALQGGIKMALDMLGNRADRRLLLVLTDGKETRISDPEQVQAGLKQLIQRALREECTISTIGLGEDVNATDLESFEQTHGKYVFSPDATQLSRIFGQTVTLLQKERVFTYTTSNPDPDGTRRSITVDLDVNDKVTSDNTPAVVTVPGLLPHVAGDHTSYALLLLLMLITPSLLIALRSFLSVYRFRSAHIIKVKPGSPYIGRHDLNDGPDDHFVEGDELIICPVSQTPHHIRCWRFNKCRCFHDHSPGSFCYHRTFPRWLRRMLDYLFAERTSNTGRTWLCRCAGDQEGC